MTAEHLVTIIVALLVALLALPLVMVAALEIGMRSERRKRLAKKDRQ
jgi:hypothetical protein